MQKRREIPCLSYITNLRFGTSPNQFHLIVLVFAMYIYKVRHIPYSHLGSSSRSGLVSVSFFGFGFGFGIEFEFRVRVRVQVRVMPHLTLSLAHLNSALKCLLLDLCLPFVRFLVMPSFDSTTLT